MLFSTEDRDEWEQNKMGTIRKPQITAHHTDDIRQPCMWILVRTRGFHRVAVRTEVEVMKEEAIAMKVSENSRSMKLHWKKWDACTDPES